MNFAFSDEQEELRASVRRFLSEKSPESEVRRLMDTTEGYDPAVWGQMADQLGLQSLTIPEEFGGSGFTYVELLVVLEEMGAALLCAPFFEAVHAMPPKSHLPLSSVMASVAIVSPEAMPGR